MELKRDNPLVVLTRYVLPELSIDTIHFILSSAYSVGVEDHRNLIQLTLLNNRLTNTVSLEHYTSTIKALIREAQNG